MATHPSSPSSPSSLREQVFHAIVAGHSTLEEIVAHLPTRHKSSTLYSVIDALVRKGHVRRIKAGRQMLLTALTPEPVHHATTVKASAGPGALMDPRQPWGQSRVNPELLQQGAMLDWPVALEQLINQLPARQIWLAGYEQALLDVRKQSEK